VLSFNPEGVASSSPGLPSAATLGKRHGSSGNPEGVAIGLVKRAFARCGRNPFRVEQTHSLLYPGVAVDGNPGLDDVTPSG